MKSISVYDLQKVSTLQKYNIFEIISPELDDILEDVLWEYGIDTCKGVEFVVSYHRCLDKQKRVGFMVVGEVRADAQFRLSPFCSVEDRMIAAGKRDMSLAKELSAMQNFSQTNYGSEIALEMEEEGELYQDMEEIERIEAEMEAMERALYNIRGEQRKRSGSLKTLREYHEAEPYEKPRRKKKNRTTLKHRHIEE